MIDSILPVILILLAIFMAYVSGANDGGAILAVPARVADNGVGKHVVVLTLAVLIGPLLTTDVAATLVSGLFDFSSDNSAVIFMLGTGVGLALVTLLTRVGLPTSLTLALVGGLTGAGLGGGASVDGRMVLRVLIIGLLAPLLGFGLAALGFILLRRFGGIASSSRTMKPMQGVAFFLLALAYAINDGQKMIAIGAVAVLSLYPSVDILSGGEVLPRLATSLVLVVLFVLGLFSRIRKVGYRLGLGLARVGAIDALVSQAAASSAVLASAAFGAPVSMTQSISGAIVGSTMSQGAHRVRWTAVSKMLGAWLITLPATFLAGYGLGFLLT